MVDILTALGEETLLAHEADLHSPADFQFVAEGVSELAPAVSLAVTYAGSTWVGDFFGGHENFSVVVPGVKGATLLVVAGGVAYIVPAARPDDYQVVSLRPIRDVLLSNQAGVVILVGYTTLGAVGAEGEMWVSERLVWDGFTEVRIASGTVVLRGFDAPSGRDVEVSLDPLSGDVVSRR